MQSDKSAKGRKRAIGNGQWAIGNGQWAMGNGQNEFFRNK